MINLEDVFVTSGVPTYTFVKPQKFEEIKVSVRSPGRCLVIEGPSGIGKSTTIAKVLEELNQSHSVTHLSARKPEDHEYIHALPEMGNIGTVIVDDFHRLPEEIKSRLSDFMKILADSGDEHSKLILIGINHAGGQLVRFTHDLGLRLDIFKLESNPVEILEKVVELGQDVLNIAIPQRNDIAELAQGSFQLVQILCHKLCVLDGITEKQTAKHIVKTSINTALEDVITNLSRQFKDPTVTFARGSKLRPEGRAPYLHILKWLSDSEDWSLDLNEAMVAHPEMKPSISQVIEKGHLDALINDNEKSDILKKYFYFERSTNILSAEDPKLVFYLKNLIWRVFTRQVGFRFDFFKSKYDFALSFAGQDRHLAEKLYQELTTREISVFYDQNEQHRIVAENLEDYLAPIYRKEASYIVVFQSPEYPQRIWTKFESDNFKERFGQNQVIPIRFSTTQAGYFSEDSQYGGLNFDPTQDTDKQILYIASTLAEKLKDDRLVLDLIEAVKDE